MGRFVTLIPRDENTYLLDFNRSCNPFCAYSSVRLPSALAGKSAVGGDQGGGEY